MSTSSLTLDTGVLTIVRDVAASNSRELIAKRNIIAVMPTKFQSKANYSDPSAWKYRYSTMTIITIFLRDKSHLNIELQDLSNQPTWNLGTLAAMNQAISDINDWLPMIQTPEITVSPSSLSFSDTEVSYNSAQQSFTVSAVYLTTDLTITPPTGFKISLVNGSGHSTSPIVIPPVGQTVASTTIYVVFSPLAITSYSSTISCSSAGAVTQTCSVTGLGTFNTFKISVKTDNAGTSSSTQFTLPLLAGETYNAVIDWGDASTTTQTTSTSPTHTYASAGTYQIKISGTFPAIYFNAGGDRRKLLSIDNWGQIVWTTFASAFAGCSNLVGSFLDAPNLTSVTNTSSMFSGCTAFNGNISGWNVSSITNMNQMFQGCSTFNQNIGSWNVSAVTTMINMFYLCSAFNQNIGSWNVGAVTNMNGMLASCTTFNQSLNSWNVSSVTNMDSMFLSCTAFNGNITSWSVGAVTNMNQMFSGCTAFNQNIGSWNVSSVTNMSGVLTNCTTFNQSLNSWNVSAVTNMAAMFTGCAAFNGNITSWSVGAVTNMSQLFQGCTAFNQNIGSWNVSSVTTMVNMFYLCSAFNQNIGSWNVGAVTSMNGMLASATAFNQNIGGWNVANVLNFTSFMLGKTAANYSTTNLDAIYNGWSLLTLKHNLSINFGSIKYTAGASAGKAILTGAPNNWTITDGGI